MFQINYYGIRQGTCYPINDQNIAEENEKGADIYWTPNNFTAWGKRKKEDLAQITSFFCEIDEGPKSEQLKKLRSVIKPSCIIETKRGFHIYWYLKNPIDCIDDPIAKADWYRDILKNRICPTLGADLQAADACRLMRAAFMKYWKDGKGTFKTDIVFDSDEFYSVDEILNAFPEKKQKPIPSKMPEFKKQEFSSDDFWSRANQLDSVQSLQKLSGTAAVNGETFSFIKKGNSLRINCNGKKSNAWIDPNGRIGSTDGAGPAIPNWIYYYQKDWKRVAELIKEYFPEVEK